MTLHERITAARKQAGLSQEQLGDKLGVSRQAISKWETGQANPDVSYITEMCRLFGVSSDWLLMGVETSASTGPERCPACRHIVTGLDNFCPNCGHQLHEHAVNSYTLLYNGSDFISGVGDLGRLSRNRKFSFSPGSPLSHPISDEEAQQLHDSAPVVLDRGMSKQDISNLLDAVVTESNFSVCPEWDSETVPSQDNMKPAAEILPARDHSLSFGGIVCAVIVGIFAAIFIGSFL